MAIEQTSFTPEAQIFPFTGLPSVESDKTRYPKAQVFYNISGGGITASGVGDSQGVDITCTLPANFAFVWTDLSVRIFNVDSSNPWDSRGFAGVVGGPTSAMTVGATDTQLSGGTVYTTNISSQTYAAQNIPNWTIITDDPSNLQTIVIAINNPNLNIAAANLDFQLRLLMYNIDQAHHVSVNTPQYVRC